jgi:hypothetical protein
MKKILLPVFFTLIVTAAGFSQPSNSLVIKPSAEAHPDTGITLSIHDFAPSMLNMDGSDSSPNGYVHAVRNHAGAAMLSSAILPGSAQAVNRNWVRAGIFTAIEVSAIYLAIDYQRRGSRGERNYEHWADRNWSVIQYAHWLVDYHDIHGIGNPYIDQLRNDLQGISPAFDTTHDWGNIDINLLRSVERNTRFITTDGQSSTIFSHSLPAFGSQQYYELIAKYYQYQAGWRDYHDYHDQLGHTGNSYVERYLFDRDGLYASPLFFDGVNRAERFNDLYRTGRAFRMILITNHIFAAFDAYFTIKVKHNRLEATSTFTPGRQFSLSYRF